MEEVTTFREKQGLGSRSGRPVDTRSFPQGPGLQTVETIPADTPERSAQFDLANAVTFWRGRVALYALLKAIGAGAGDSVVVPGYTCFAVPSAVAFTGAKALYADIDPAQFNLTKETISRTVKSHPGENVKAVIVQHTFGIPADTAPIVEWAREHGVIVIEDCAHVWGSRYRDASGDLVPVGTLGDAAFYSSQWTKPVSTGLGGWAVAWNPELARRLRQFHSTQCAVPSGMDALALAAQVFLRSLLANPRIYGLAKAAYQFFYSKGCISGTSSKEELQGAISGDYAKRMSGFQEWLLRRKFRQTRVLDHRRKLKSIYDSALKEACMTGIGELDGVDPVLLRYPVRLSRKAEALAESKRQGKELGDWYSRPIDGPESMSMQMFGYAEGGCPEGERAAKTVVNLPMELHVTESSARRLVEWLKAFA
jgi:dTDP-4-amino-4,6-dideoxygalactose transaminase